MKREETYIPYKERTPKELCRDINLKAEKLFVKTYKHGLLFFAVVFLMLVGLQLLHMTYVDWRLGVLVIGTIMAGGFYVFKKYSLKKENKYYDKYYILILYTVILVWIALERHENIYMYWGLGAIVVGAIMVVNLVFFKMNHRLVNEMNLAVTPKQHLNIGKRLKKCIQNRNYLCITLLFCLPVLTFHDLMNGWDFTKWLIVYVIGICTESWIDSDFNDDLDELEFRFEE